MVIRELVFFLGLEQFISQINWVARIWIQILLRELLDMIRLAMCLVFWGASAIFPLLSTLWFLNTSSFQWPVADEFLFLSYELRDGAKGKRSHWNTSVSIEVMYPLLGKLSKSNGYLCGTDEFSSLASE